MSFEPAGTAFDELERQHFGLGVIVSWGCSTIATIVAALLAIAELPGTTANAASIALAAPTVITFAAVFGALSVLIFAVPSAITVNRRLRHVDDIRIHMIAFAALGALIACVVLYLLAALFGYAAHPLDLWAVVTGPILTPAWVAACGFSAGFGRWTAWRRSAG